MAKMSRAGGLHDDALAQLHGEYEVLRELQHAFPQDDRFGTPEPLGYLECAGSGIMIMRSFNGGDLARRLRAQDALERNASCRLAGSWLRKLHESDRSGMQTGMLGVADKLDYLTSTYGAVIGDDTATRKAWSLLAREAVHADLQTVPMVRLHGDFKPENMLCNGTKYVGLDIHWQHVGAAVYDLAPFLNHLRLVDRALRSAHADQLLEQAESEFLAGYGGTVPLRALRWAQLYFALCYLGGYRMRGRAATIYAYFRVRPLVRSLERQLQASV